MEVKDIVQDKYGNIWLKDDVQLGKYDGKNFYDLGNPITDEDQRRIPIYDLEADSDGTIWLSTQNGLYYYHDLTGFQKVEINLSDNHKNIIQIVFMYSDSAEGMYLGTDEGEILYFNTKQKQSFYLSKLPSKSEIKSLYLDKYSVLWISSLDGIYTLSDQTLEKIYDFSGNIGKSGTGVKRLFRLKSDNNRYVLASKGDDSVLLFDIKFRCFEKKVKISSETDVHINDLCNLKGPFWLICTNAGVYSYNSNNQSFYKITKVHEYDSTREHDIIYTIYIAKNEIVWYGKHDGLTKSQYVNEQFVNIAYDKLDKILELKLVPEWGKQWIAISQNFGIFSFTENGQTFKPVQIFKPGKLKYAKLIPESSVLLIQDEEYLTLYKTIKNESLSNPIFSIKLPGKHIDKIEAKDGKNLFVLMDNLLYVLSIEPRTFKPVTTLSNTKLSSIAISKSGRIFLGGEKLYELQSDSLVESNHHFHNEIFDMAFDGDDILWVGSNHLYSLDIQTNELKFYDSKYGIVNENITNLIYDQRRNLWAGALQGLMKFDIDKQRAEIYTYKDGLCINNSLLGLSLISEGVVGVLGNGYFSYFRPRERSNIFKGVEFEIESIRIDGEEIGFDWQRTGTITLAPGKTQLAMSYRFPCFLENSMYNIQYQLTSLSDKADGLWTNADSDNTLQFNRLRADNYILNIRAYSRHNPEISKMIEMNVLVLQPFYQSKWFSLLMFLTASSIFFLIFYYRDQQRKEMERFRLNIARDLHDDMGANLSNIKLISELEVLKNNENTEIFKNIADKSSLLLESISDIIWNINPGNNDLITVISKIQQNAIEVLEPLNINLNFDININQDQINVRPEVKKDFYFICKEAFNNISKYASAKNVSFKCWHKGKRIYATIFDDGIGFDPMRKTKGNGLKNMKDRADRMNANLEIISSANLGTSIHVNFSAS